MAANKNPRSEARSTKQIRITKIVLRTPHPSGGPPVSKDQTQMSFITVPRSLFRTLINSNLEFVSDFDIRISDLCTFEIWVYVPQSPALEITGGRQLILFYPVSSNARFSKRVYWVRKVRVALPVGPLRCLPMITSALPWSGLSRWYTSSR